MKWIFIPIFAFLLASFETNFFAFFELNQTLPDLIFIASFFILLRRNFREAIFFAFFGVVFRELFYPSSLSFYPLAVIFSIAVLGIISESFEKADFWPVFILGILASAAYEFFIIFQSLILKILNIASLAAIRFAPINYAKFWALEIAFNIVFILLAYILIFYGKKFIGKRV